MVVLASCSPGEAYSRSYGEDPDKEAASPTVAETAPAHCGAEARILPWWDSAEPHRFTNHLLLQSSGGQV
jgi:hypothetical protein